MMCHEDPELTTVRNGQTVSMFVQAKKLKRTVHADVSCIECHDDVNTEEFLHADQSKKLKEVDCGSCHKTSAMQFFAGIHGQALKLNEPYAPDCKECHGTHDILSQWNSKSRTYKMNIPILCGNCHKEGAPVARIYNIDEHNIIENYSQGIHGKGLFQSGLLVTATCNNCHNSHLILPHESPNSSVNPKRIARTCMKCHVNIEQTHRKVIKSELWEKYLGSVPSCTDCHPPHKVEYQKIEDVIPNQLCLKCHSNATLEFTGYLTHATHNDNPILFWSFWIMTSLLVVVFVFFGLHTIFWLPRSLKQRKINKHKIPVGPTKYYRRFNKRQRFTHIMVILSFVLLAFTGMILKFAHMEWAQWMSNLIGGVKAAGNIHRFAAAVTFCYFTFHLLTLI